MQRIDSQLLYSPSDLIRFLESPFASWMERARLEEPGRFVPDEDPEEKKLVQQKGYAHENAFLRKLKDDGHEVFTVDTNDRVAAEQATREAMNEQAEVVFQAYFSDGIFAGYADFLVRNNEGLYEPWDTKLSRQVKPYFLVQLCCYADLVETVTRDRPPSVYVVLGDGQTARFSTCEFYDYYRSLRGRFLRAMEEFDLALPPEPEPGADHGRWTSHAEKILAEKRSLALVADIRTSQIRRLEDAGIQTVEDLAEATAMPSGLKMKEMIFQRLHQQAALQVETEKNGGAPAFTVLGEAECIQGKGLCELPPSDPGEVFFDLEGYPLIDDGLEYLFGATYRHNGELAFRDWWAHDRDGEREAFAACIDWLHERWQRHPQMHIYHYAAYEVSAMKRLMCRYGIRESKVDDLLRNGVFVDLYRVIRHGLRVGTPSYSIKDIERVYRPKREGEVSTSMGSVVEYARWIESGEPGDWRESPILKAIRDYNKDDCDSTAELADWLRERQREAGISFRSPAEKEAEEEAEAEKQAFIDQKEAEAAAIEERLLERSLGANDSDQRMYRTAADLWSFYRRQAKPIFWQMFERAAMTSEEQWEEPCCLQGVVLDNPAGEPEKRSLLFTYHFDPEQECKIRGGQNVMFSHQLQTKLPLFDIDLDKGVLRIKIGKNKLETAFPEGIPGTGTLILDEFVAPGAKEDALHEIIAGLAEDDTAAPTVLSLLKRTPPAALSEKGVPADPLALARSVITSMDGAVLCLQGPPGTGKTYSGARLASDILDRGGRIGITSLSHDATVNFLAELAQQRKGDLTGFKFGDKGTAHPVFDECSGLAVERSASRFQIPPDDGLVFAGTGWVFSRPEWEGQLDVLFVDEAGQLPLADVVAVARSAANVVLLGDQRQLEQPSQAVHPGRSGWSALEYLLDGRPTIARNEGIFLPETRRLRPEVCSVVSDLFYEGRLHSHPTAKGFALELPKKSGDLPSTHGVHCIPVPHEGNTQSSEEEAVVIERLVEQLLKTVKVTHENRPLRPRDILIIAPYNLQVKKLAARLPDHRVGTVDRFQGQEAEIVILSLCCSAGEYGTRGLDFLLNPRRLNVALSRARCLALIVGDPRILETTPTNVSLMRQLSSLARITSGGE